METTTTTQEKTELPKTLLLGGVAYNVDDNPELKAFVTGIQKNVAQVEKAKLYTQITELKEGIKALEKVTPIETKQKESPVDFDKFKEDITSSITEVMTEKFSSLVKKELAPITERNAQTEKMAVADYRNKLISENQGKCIPELVAGSTREELDKALTHSTELFSKYGKVDATPDAGVNGEQKVVATTDVQKTTVETPAATTEQKVVEKPVVIQAPLRTTAAVETDLKIGEMSMDEFAKNRESLKSKVTALVG